jgi:hypothetical protein
MQQDALRGGAFRRLLPAIVALLCAGCFPSRPLEPVQDASTDAALGVFKFTPPRGETLTIEPTSCSAGDRQFFLGADFADPKTPVFVRLVVEPLEWPAVRVISPNAADDSPIVFRRPECKVLRATFEPTGWRINDVYDYRITIDADCTRADGTTLVGNASTTHCH